MTNVVIVVKDGRVEQAYCRNKNVEVEVLDMDTQDIDDLEQREWRLKQIQNAICGDAVLWAHPGQAGLDGCPGLHPRPP